MISQCHQQTTGTQGAQITIICDKRNLFADTVSWTNTWGYLSYDVTWTTGEDNHGVSEDSGQ